MNCKNCLNCTQCQATPQFHCCPIQSTSSCIVRSLEPHCSRSLAYSLQSGIAHTMCQPDQDTINCGNEASIVTVDLSILGRAFKASVNNLRNSSAINGSTARYYCLKRMLRFPQRDDTILVEITVNDRCHKLNCVVRYNQHEPIILGSDFVQAFGVRLHVNDVSVHKRVTQSKKTYSHPYQTESSARQGRITARRRCTERRRSTSCRRNSEGQRTFEGRREREARNPRHSLIRHKKKMD